MLKKNLLLIIIVFAVALYSYNLSSLPFAMHGDEGETAAQARDFLHGKTRIFSVGWYDLPSLSFAPHAVTMLIAGETVLGDRLGSVVFGVLTIPFFYLLVALFFNKRVVLIATFLLVTSHLWIAFSRIGITYVQATFLVVSCFYFLVKGLYTKEKKYFIVGGLFLGLCFYSYYAARIAPLVIFLYLLLPLLKEKNRRQLMFLLSTFFISTLLIFVPQGKYFWEHPQAFVSRTKDVFIYSQINREWVESEYGDVNNISLFFLQLKRSFNIFIGDQSSQYGYKGQLFDYATLGLIGLGVIYSLVFFRVPSFFLLLWFSLTLFLGQVLTTPPPIFLPRFVVGIPVLYIFSALGIELLYKVFKRKDMYALHVLTGIMILFIAINNIYIYFFQYAKQQEMVIAGDFNATAATKISYFLNTFSKDYKSILVSEPFLYAGFGTLRFLARERMMTSLSGEAFSSQLESLPNKQAIYIFYPSYHLELTKLQRLYPDGKLKTFTNSVGKVELYAYVLPPNR